MSAQNERRILVIDDDVPILEAIGDLLRSEGFDVRQEPESIRAVQSAREYDPDVVLLDLMMPGADGVSVAQGLRREPGTRAVPVVLMTAHPDVSRIALEMSADAWLRKPFSARALLRAVRGDPFPDQTKPEFTVS
jgi:two-component system, OmpR family, response regulator MtrA